MGFFLYILLNNISPIFFLIFLGYLLGRKFRLDIQSFTKINFYIFVPALIFVKVYETRIELGLLKALLFGALLLALLFIAGNVIAGVKKYPMSTASAFKNAVMFYNSGNFGLPLITLVFKDSPAASYAVSIQIMILLVQNLTTNTLGFYNAGRSHMHYKDSIKAILKMPAVYAIASAILLKAIPFDFKESFIWPAIVYAKDGCIPIALLTLGAQLSQTHFQRGDSRAYLATAMRLLGGPLLAYLLIVLLKMDPIMARVLFISSAVPTAVNTALIAIEFKNETDFAAQVVLYTTLLSAITLTGVIFLSQYLF